MFSSDDSWLDRADVDGARRRHDHWQDRDPFPDVLPSLLGSSAYLDYIRVTGMVHPFRGWKAEKAKPDDQIVKPASYEMRAGKAFFRYDDQGNLKEQNLENHAEKTFIRLPANSITFVSTEETLRLPNYIAARFNLRIKHVHRGILLGTGPLIDPGYDLPILIPLHNLTSEDYFIGLDEGLIWIEFTKVYPSPTHAMYTARPPKLPEHTRKKDFRTFLFKAGGGVPIRSSIPGAVKEAQRRATTAEQKVLEVDRRIRNLGIVGILALLITVASILIPVFDLVMSVNDRVAASRAETIELRRQLDELRRQVPSETSSPQKRRPGAE